jgi:hypothetical protein
MIPNRAPIGERLPDDLQTTLALMQRYMVEGSRNPALIELAGRIQGDRVRPAFYLSHTTYEIDRMRAVYDWVRQNIAYVHDGYEGDRQRLGEIVRDVEVTLRGKAGDCDDHTILVGAILLATFEGPGRDGIQYAPVEVYLFGSGGVPGHVFPVGVTSCGHKVIIDTSAPPGSKFGDVPGGGSPRAQFWPCNFFGGHY